MVLEESAVAFTVVKIAGAANLVLLGVRTLWRVRRCAAGSAADGVHPAPSQAAQSVRKSLRVRLIAGLLNPKTGLFYVAVLPPIIPAGAAISSLTLIFAVVDAIVAGTYFAVLAALAALLLPYLRRPR